MKRMYFVPSNLETIDIVQEQSGKLNDIKNICLATAIAIQFGKFDEHMTLAIKAGYINRCMQNIDEISMEFSRRETN